MIYMAMNLSLLMITLITKTVSIDGIYEGQQILSEDFVDETFVKDEQNLCMEKWLYAIF